MDLILMKLWTWQNPVFDITDHSHHVDTLNNSQYLMADDYSDLEAIERHKKAYQNIWEKYKTNQILWCYSSIETATSGGALDYKDKVLWKLDIPKSFVLDTTCGMAWQWIVFNRNCSYPNCFQNMLLSLKGLLTSNGISCHYNDNHNDFNRYWSSLNLKELYSVLSVDPINCKTGCPTIIIKHPVNEQWVVSKCLHSQVSIQKKI